MSGATRVFSVSLLADGTYEVMVVDADARPDGTLALELAVSSGAHRGEVVTINARGLGRDWAELLATPATLTVRAGEPHLTFD